MKGAEWWVMRVVQPAEGVLEPAVASDVASGALVVVSGDVCEPIDCYMDQQSALDRLAMIASPGKTFKVVLSADV